MSVIDVDQMTEVRRIPVADGPGMISFTPDGKLAYVCSSFTPEVDIVNTSTYAIVKKIQVTSHFSPNIFTSPKGEWIAMTHKDVGKVTVINTATQSVTKAISTGAIAKAIQERKPDIRYVAGYMSGIILFLKHWLSDRMFVKLIMSQMSS